MSPFAAAFARCLPNGQRAPDDGALDAAWARVQASFPGAPDDVPSFAAWLAPRATGDFSTWPLEELHLAWACAHGSAPALQRLERDYFARLAPTIARIDADRAFVDEVLQVVRERLLVAPPGGTPRIGTWEGAAPLASWLRAIAVRTALNTKRAASAGPPPDDDDVLETLSTSGPEPELALLRARHRGEFREVFRETLATLTPRERTVLRLQAIDGLTLERIGALYRVNKSTVSRWLDQVHEALAQGTRLRLGQRLSLDPEQLESFVRAMRSNLELSVSALLGSQSQESHERPR